MRKCAYTYTYKYTYLSYIHRGMCMLPVVMGGCSPGAVSKGVGGVLLKVEEVVPIGGVLIKLEGI